jgi:hypothetical protein
VVLDGRTIARRQITKDPTDRDRVEVIAGGVMVVARFTRTVTFRFSGVRDYTHADSSAELQAHYNDGVDLGVYLTGGYIRIVAESVSVVGEARM